MCLERKYFNVLFIIFILVGFTGHVWGANTHTTELSDNFSPEQKNLMNYIMSKSNCDLGEATLVLQMLTDQLSDTQSGAFLLYMMNPNAPANLPGLDPTYTLNDYFTNDYQYKSIKTRFDQDLSDFGQMTHKQKLEYCKHCNNDLLVLINELSDSGDVDKINYVLENSGLYGEAFNNKTQAISDKIHEDRYLPHKLTGDGKALISSFNNMSDPVSDAMMDYDYLKAMGINPIIKPTNENFDNIDNAINTIQSSIKKLDAGISLAVAIVAINVFFIFGASIVTVASAGAFAPLLVIAISIEAVGAAIFTTLVDLLCVLGDIKDELEDIKNTIIKLK